MPYSRLHRLAFCAALALPTLMLAAPYADAKRGQEKQAEELDYLALGARLVADGHHDRALAVLQQVDPADDELDRPKLHFLLGSIYMEKQLYGQARDEFSASIKAGQSNEAIYVNLAQAHFLLNDFRKAIQALDKAPTVAAQNPGTFSMRAEAHWKLKEPKQAVATLDRGITRFPEFGKFFQMKMAYLIELGLYQEVVRVGDVYLARQSVVADEFVAVAEGLRRSKQLGEARNILERAYLRFPDNLSIQLQLANVYNDLGRPITAAMLYERAARLNAAYYFEAAELYKQAGRHARALSLNGAVLDPKKKLKQRLAILLEMERFEMVAAMEASLSRSGLLKDEAIRYALAYGHYQNNDYESAEQHLKLLSDSALFEKAVALRKAMATCKESGWACY